MSYKPLILRFLLPLAYLFTWFLVKLYHLTCRVEVKGPLRDYLDGDKPVLLTCWHQDMIFNFVYLLTYARRRKIATVISTSEDGEIAAYLVSNFGGIVVRGSSSKEGRKALKRLIRTVLREKAVGMIVCDGPRPPGRITKIGIVALSHKSGYPILKIRSWGDRCYLFKKTWCKLSLILPFSHVVIWSDPPLFIPPDIKKQELERYRFIVEKGLNEMADFSENYFRGANA